MALPNKGLTLATKTLNQFAPFADRLEAWFSLCETSGSTIANDGVRATAGGFDWGATGSLITAGTGAITFGSDAAEGPYIQTFEGTTNRAYATLYTNSSGSTKTFSVGTFIVRFKDPGGTPGANRVIVSSGSAGTGTGNVLIIYRSTTNVLTVNIAGEQFLFSGLDFSLWHTVVVCFGGGRYPRVIVNRNNSTVTAAGGMQIGTLQTAGNVQITNTRSIMIGAVTAGGSAFTIQCNAAGFWNKRLDTVPQWQKIVNRLLADPWLPGRALASTANILSQSVCMVASRPTEDGVTFTCVTGKGSGVADINAALPATVSVRIKWGTSNDPTSANFLNNTSTGASSGDVLKQIQETFTELPDGWIYYMPFYSTDGFTTEFPFCGGLAKVRTKRTEAGTFDFGVLTDPHLNNTSDIWTVTDLANIKFGAVNYFTGASRKAFAYERSIQEKVLWHDHDFHVMLGDYLMSDQYKQTDGSASLDDRNDNLFYYVCQQAAHEIAFAHELYQDAAVFVISGNHETQNGYSQCGDRVTGQSGMRGAYQAISTTVIKMFWPMPTNGEDEGDPSLDDTLSWLAPNTGHIAAYSGGRAQYLIDYVTGVHANPRGLVKSPLEIYYSFEWGGGANKTLFTMTHATFYTDPGDSIAVSHSVAGYRQRPLGTFTRGARQEAWIEATYAASDAPNKLEFAHQHTGGVEVGDAADVGGISDNDTSYGRNNGTAETGAEHLRDHARARRHGRNAKFTGHDHRFCHARSSDTVNEINVPTTGAPSHSGGYNAGAPVGWHLSQHEQNAGFGLAQSDGADLVTLGDGLGTALGNIKMLNIMGNLSVTVDGHADGPLLKMIRTEITRGIRQTHVITQTGSPTGGTWSLFLRTRFQENAETFGLSAAWNITDTDLKTLILTSSAGLTSSEVTVSRTGTGTNFEWTIITDTAKLSGTYDPGVTSALTGGTSPSVAIVTTNNRLNNLPTYGERNVGEQVTPAADVATLSLAPINVLAAHLVSDVVRSGATPFWVTDPTNKNASGVAPWTDAFPYDWDNQPTTALTLDSSVNENPVNVMAVPAIMYEARLGAAEPEAGGKRQGYNRISRERIGSGRIGADRGIY